MTVYDLRKHEETRYAPNPDALSISQLEDAYLKSVQASKRSTKQPQPIYGADCHGILMGPTVREWRLSSLKSNLDETIVHSGEIKGVHTPFLYFGAWQTSFGLHTEDLDLYSLNYHHFGAPKYWMSIKPDQGHDLKKLLINRFQERYKYCANYHRHKSIIMSPAALRRNKIAFACTLQRPGEFIVTFPYGYHGGFNCGLNCAEAVNFMVAPEKWLEYGKRASRCLCQQPSLTLFSLAPFVQRYQPERFQDWIQGTDFGPHIQHGSKITAVNIPSLHDVLANRAQFSGTISSLSNAEREKCRWTK